MLLLYGIVSCVLFGGSSAVEHETKCYGGSIRMPFSYTPPLFKGQLYLTTKSDRFRKLLMDKGESKDPRLKVSVGSAEFTDLTEKDEGTFSISYDGSFRYDIIKLTISDCAQQITRFYGERFSHQVSRQAEFLEFTPIHSVDQPKILWNRTDPQTNTGGRGRMKRNVWEMMNVKPPDMGHYNFRAKDNTLLTRILLKVTEYTRHYHVKVNERLFIENESDLWTVTFNSEGKRENKTVIKEGHLSTDEWNSVSWDFYSNVEAVHRGIAIDPVLSIHAGVFEFRDPQGHLAQTVQVEVTHDPPPTSVYIAVTAGIVVVTIICCCCVKRCCCKKSSSKRDESAPQPAAAPAVYYHDLNQPAGQSYSAVPSPDYSYQPLNSVDSREPRTTSLEPSVYNPVNIHVNSPQPEAAPLGGQGFNPPTSFGSDFLSSEPEPRFELKGLPSAPPLSSDSAFCNVYTSDKLNFL